MTEDPNEGDDSRRPLNTAIDGQSQPDEDDTSHFHRPATGQYTNVRSSDSMAEEQQEEHPLLYPSPPAGYYQRQHPMRLTNWPRLILASVALGFACFAIAAVIDVSTPTGGIEPGVDERSVADGVLAAMDRSADPCSDFYEYACGSWRRATSIPADRSNYGKSFDVIGDRIRLQVRGLLEEELPGRGSVASDFYSACMTNMGLGSKNTKPLRRFRRSVREADNPKDLAKAIGNFHAKLNSPLFDAGVGIDDKNPEQYILFLGQGGLGMPHRDDYLSSKEKYTTLRAQYLVLMKAMLKMARKARLLPRGGDIDALAGLVMKFETGLANVTIPPEDMRDPEKVYNKRQIEDFPREMYIDEYLKAAGFEIEKLKEGLVVDSPQFFKALAGMFGKMEEDEELKKTVQAYLAFHATWAMAGGGLLGEELYKANFAFHQALYGTKQMSDRWKLCQSKTVHYFGDAVGASFVERYFTEDTRNFAQNMVKNIRKSFLDNLDEVKWMDEKTKKLAEEKVASMGLKIGYSDELDQYDDVFFQRGDYEGGVRSAIAHAWNKDLNKLGKPVDKKLWDMFPQEVNAYYSPSRNEIVFPAGILQQPFFSDAFPDAMNYGAIGSVVGHEISHSVDDQGRKYDKTGLLSSWWTRSSAKAFETRTQCFVDLYDTYKPRETTIHVLGNLTLGENLADTGGVKVAYRAFKLHAGANASADARPPNSLIARELTNDQLFFVAYAQNYCTNYRKKSLELQMKSDPHSPDMFRVLGPLSQFDEFAKAFECKNGTKYNKEKRCRLW